MKHDFSRELVAFNLAQDIIQTITIEHETSDAVLFSIQAEKLRTLYFARLGEAPNETELQTIYQILAHLGDMLIEDCGSFALGHNLFHLLEVSEADKRGEIVRRA